MQKLTQRRRRRRRRRKWRNGRDLVRKILQIRNQCWRPLSRIWAMSAFSC